jgi:PAT family beta-lactamase induction signal transducer AmpG
MDTTPFLNSFRNRRLAAILFLGFSSGLPLALTGGTLQAWLSDEKIDIRTIGIFSLVGLPYTFKFLWSPLMDRFSPPGLDRRRSWVFATQLLLAILIATMGAFSPQRALFSLAVLALWVAWTSASQDIVIDAYRADLLQPSERGVGATLSVFGYRLAMMVSGAFALILSDHLSWRQTYWVMATIMLLCTVVTFLSPKPDQVVAPPRTLEEAIVGPLTDFFSRPGAWAILILIVLYKLGDAFAGALTTRFLLAGTESVMGLGFSKTEVGVVNKGLGLFVTIVGGLFGGGWMATLGLYRSLMIFGLLQALSNLTFMVLATAGKHYGLMVAAIGIENFTGGMGTAAMVALLMSLCHARFSATQFALLSALAAIGRVWVGPASGYMVVALGWPLFFFVTFLTALPGLGLLWRLRQEISGL